MAEHKTHAEHLKEYKSIKDWSPSSSHPGYDFSPSTKKFWCPIHSKTLSGANLTNHKKTHEKEAKLEPETASFLESASKPGPGKTSPFDLLVDTPSYLIMQENWKKKGEQGTMIVSDHEIISTFEKLHAQRKIPDTWGLYRFLKMCFAYWCKRWGYDLKLTQEVDILDSEQKKWIENTILENKELEKVEEETGTTD